MCAQGGPTVNDVHTRCSVDPPHGLTGGERDAAAFAVIAIDVLGNGEDYGLHLRTSELTRPWQSYRASFVASPAWRAIRFPFADFVPHRTETPLNIHLLRRIGVVAIGRAFSADVAIGGVRFYGP